ncbi:MAG TPA: tetratricopeptide repeat protein [Candidatus Binatia bacterium]|jgi:tetratricopeptide (TPR) repeat protein
MRDEFVYAISFALFGLLLISCENENIRRNAETIRQQEEDIDRMRKELAEQEKQRACRAAFRSFEQAQAANNPREAESFYREGLALCPSDDVAHYELGRVLADLGRRDEARREFEAALNINPQFSGARQELEKLTPRRGEP